MTSSLIAICVSAALCAAFFTEIVRRLAPPCGLVDHPDGHRKLQRRSVPLGGGLAVALALATVMATVLLLPNPWQRPFAHDWLDVASFSIASFGIVALGLFDDRFSLRGRFKLLGQVACVSVLLFSGLMIREVVLFGFSIQLGLLSVPFTMAWMLGAVNAINLLDGIDGLAATLGLILCATLAALAFMTGQDAIGAAALIFASSLLGFVPFNLPPARIYLGDAGSMLIGLMLGALSIRGALKGPGTVLLAAPLAVLTIPIFDSAAAILRRRLTGRSIYCADRGHLHHQLLDRLGSNARVLLCVGIACVVTSVAALGSVAFRNDWIAFASIVAVVGVFIVTGLFGRGEFLLLAGKFRNLSASLFHPVVNRAHIRQNQVRLQGSRQWDLLWQTVTESAEKLSLARVRLDLNLPAMREGYNATWERGQPAELEDCWCVELPLVLEHRTVGRLQVRGRRNGSPAHEDIEKLLDMLGPFEEKLLAITQEQKLPHSKHLQSVP